MRLRVFRLNVWWVPVAGVWVKRESSGSTQVFGGDHQTDPLQHAGDVAVFAAGVEHIEVYRREWECGDFTRK